MPDEALGPPRASHRHSMRWRTCQTRPRSTEDTGRGEVNPEELTIEIMPATALSRAWEGLGDFAHIAH